MDSELNCRIFMLGQFILIPFLPSNCRDCLDLERKLFGFCFYVFSYFFSCSLNFKGHVERPFINVGEFFFTEGNKNISLV